MERRKDRHENRNKRQRWSYSRRPGIWRKKQSRHDGEHARTFYEKRQVSVQVLTLPWLCVISFILLIFLKKSDTHWFIWIAFFLKLRKQNLYQSGRLQSMGSQRVGYNSVTRNTCMWVTEELRDTWGLVSHHLICRVTSVFIIHFSPFSLADPPCLHSLQLLGSHNSTPRHVSLALMLAALNLCLFFSSKWQQPCFKARCFPFWLTGNVYVEIWRLCDICQKLRNTI